MKIRYGNYTVYKGQELALYEARHETPVPFTHFIIKWDPTLGKPLNSFSQLENGDYICVVKREEVVNAFFVQTKALYKNHVFSVYAYFPALEAVDVNTNDHTIGQKLQLQRLVDGNGKAFYAGEVRVLELEKLWEERSESSFELPLPEKLETYKEISFP